MSVPPAAARRSRADILLEAGFLVLCLGCLTLFTDAKARAAGLILKPFDAVALAVLPLMLVVLVVTGRLRVSGASAVFGAYIVVHTWSAFALGPSNGVREALQSAELVLLFVVLHALSDRIDWPSVGRLFAVGLSVIAAYTALWHMAHGYFAGWKRLDGPKLAFLVLPTVILSAMLFARARSTARDHVVLALLFVVVLFSGERKAFLHLVTMVLVLLALGYLDPLRFLLGAGLAVATGLLAVSTNDYVANQFASLAGLASDRLASSAELQAGYLPTTMSNAQRLFAMDVSRHLIGAYPALGIGTNGYFEYVLQSYPLIADWLKVGIHNEFLRILVENGLVGLAAFVAIWARTVGWLLVRWRTMPVRFRGLYLFALSAALYEVTFEGSGNEVFLFMIVVALMPDIFRAALARALAARTSRHDPPGVAPEGRGLPQATPAA